MTIFLIIFGWIFVGFSSGVVMKLFIEKEPIPLLIYLCFILIWPFLWSIYLIYFLNETKV